MSRDLLATGADRSITWRWTVFWRRTRTADARRFASDALDIAQRRGERGYESWALYVLGEIAARDDPPDVETAMRLYGEAAALATDLGMRPLIAHCHLGLGKLYRRTGKREQAREHLTAAMTMYQEMDMTYWLEQAQPIG